MTEESERMLTLLQEVAALKEEQNSGTDADAGERRKRREEIGEEIKRLARKAKKQR